MAGAGNRISIQVLGLNLYYHCTPVYSTDSKNERDAVPHSARLCRPRLLSLCRCRVLFLYKLTELSKPNENSK